MHIIHTLEKIIYSGSDLSRQQLKGNQKKKRKSDVTNLPGLKAKKRKISEGDNEKDDKKQGGQLNKCEKLELSNCKLVKEVYK